MLVDELHIPHRNGTIRVPLDERVTVFAGLDRRARRRMAALMVDALAGEGPASARVRDGLGQRAVVSTEGVRPDEDEDAVTDPTPPIDTDSAALARLMIVTAADLGLDDQEPDIALLAERSTAAAAHRQLVRELGVLEAGAAERARLVDELNRSDDNAPRPTPIAAPRNAETDAALADAVPNIDSLLLRREAADTFLLSTVTASRMAAGIGTSTDTPGDPRDGSTPDDAGTGLLAALGAWRHAQDHRAVVQADDGASEADVAEAIRSEDAATVVFRRAVADLTAARHAARAEIGECDRELRRIAEEVGIPVSAGDPGTALTATIRDRSRRTRGATVGRHIDIPTDRGRRRAIILSHIAELPTDEDVRSAEQRTLAAAERLERLDARCPKTVPLEQVRNALLGRTAALRPTGFHRSLPLILDDPLSALDTDARFDLLDIIARVSLRAQIIILTQDQVITTWARHCASRGELRLIDLGAPAR